VIVMTQHARERAEEMHVSEDCIGEILAEPDVDYPQRDRGPGRRIAQRGDLAVAYVREPSGHRVLTVLLRKVEQWQR
jgi:hypothetical protein